VLFGLLGACRAPRQEQPEHVYVYAFQHANGKPCPRDYILVHGFFTEPDGTREDACAAPRGTPTQYTFDLLKSGESATLTIPARVIPQEVAQ
jgi:hypothetical protein